MFTIINIKYAHEKLLNALVSKRMIQEWNNTFIQKFGLRKMKWRNFSHPNIPRIGNLWNFCRKSNKELCFRVLNHLIILEIQNVQELNGNTDMTLRLSTILKSNIMINIRLCFYQTAFKYFVLHDLIDFMRAWKF